MCGSINVDSREARGRAAPPVARGPGFTLLELLVVMAVLAILAGLLFPVLAAARERARRSVCLAQVRQLATAHRLYTDDWDDHFPEWRFLIPVEGRREPDSLFWMEYLRPYYRTPAITHDPAEVGPPLPMGEGTRLADYALMTWGSGGTGTFWHPYFRWAGLPYTRAHVRRAAETICLMDGYTTTRTSRGFEDRHRGGVNAAFLDGHARWLRFRELYRTDVDATGFHWYHYATIDR